MALFWDLRISKRSKFALCFVFGLGIFTCAGGIMRTVQLHHVFYETYDVTWGARWAFALTHVEACLGAICASVPALKNSLQRLLRAVVDLCSLGSANRGGSGGSGPGSTQSLQIWHRSAGGIRRDDGEGGGGGGSKAVRRLSKSPFVDVFGASEQELVVSPDADVLRECAAAAAAPRCGNRALIWFFLQARDGRGERRGRTRRRARRILKWACGRIRRRMRRGVMIKMGRTSLKKRNRATGGRILCIIMSC
ncbi:hypothetical protein BK809_0001299 [Diplodia seriata]|uniref:Rhodopsin domain-containing protein n=1 Tax=Diplodia seriata TaxID=420778 RepID=A0A1S8B972_9PEZI|nr:hypothetical protein BK809_0001299 [Diplodia seriata]